MIGIDLVDCFLERAKKSVPKAKFIKMDIRELEFPMDYFDGIWASMILLHLNREEVLPVLKRFNDILKSKGKLFIGVKEGTGESIVTDKLSDNYERFFTYFTEQELRDFLEEADFKVIKLNKKTDESDRGQAIIRIICEKIN